MSVGMVTWDGAWRERVLFECVERVQLSFDRVRTKIRRNTIDPPPVHPQVRAVYYADPAGGPGVPDHLAARAIHSLRLTRGRECCWRSFGSDARDAGGPTAAATPTKCDKKPTESI